MKLMTLNCWGGKVHEALLEFFRRYSGDIDVFCLQEVFGTETGLEFSNGAKMNLYQDLKSILKDYNCYHASKSKGYDYTGYTGDDVYFGNALFVKKDISVERYEELFEEVVHGRHDWRETAIAKAQAVTFSVDGKLVSVCNFHGMWINGTKKKDTPERIEQSEHLKKMLDGFEGEKILAGDFNLLPDGESIKILEQGMKNLIKDYGITSTRSSLYTGEVKYADYVLTTPGIDVKSFEVLPGEVSDHLALVVEF